MNKIELEEIIKKHELWLCDGDGGERADLRGADLRGADLSDADLSDADLRGADLRGADLRGANLRGCVGNRLEIKSIFCSETYPVTYTHDVMQIGCERHLISEWKKFDDDRIAEMDGEKALGFWRDNKEFILNAINKFPAKKRAYRD